MARNWASSQGGIRTVSIGSYPRLQEGRFVNQIVLRCLNAETLAAAESDVRALLAETAQRHRL